MFFNKSKFFYNSRAQGTIEYLVIIGVVVVVSLVVVSLLTSQPGSVVNVSKTSNKVGSLVHGIGITESLVEPTDGNFVVKLLNNSGGTITVSNVRIGDSSVNFSEDLAQSGSKLFKVNTNQACELGKVVSEDVVITYVTSDGLTKTVRYPVQVMFDCTPFNIAQANLANQCPSCSGITPDGNATASQVLSGYSFYGTGTTKLTGSMSAGSNVVLRSGQNTVYTSGDDASYFGNRKSYTDNGDGTVTDNNTGLMWQKDHYNNCQTVSWADAISYCEGATTAGYTNWRLPTYVELATLPDINYPSSSFLNSVFTQTGWNSTCYGYWSSTTVPSITYSAYNLYSGSCYISADPKAFDFSYGVRCVRSS